MLIAKKGKNNVILVQAAPLSIHAMFRSVYSEYPSNMEFQLH